MSYAKRRNNSWDVCSFACKQALCMCYSEICFRIASYLGITHRESLFAGYVLICKTTLWKECYVSNNPHGLILPKFLNTLGNQIERKHHFVLKMHLVGLGVLVPSRNYKLPSMEVGDLKITRNGTSEMWRGYKCLQFFPPAFSPGTPHG